MEKDAESVTANDLNSILAHAIQLELAKISASKYIETKGPIRSHDESDDRNQLSFFLDMKGN